MANSRLSRLPVATLLLAGLSAAALAQEPVVPAGAALTYKRAAGRELKLFVERPPDWKAADRRPAIVFFFGGGWSSGSPQQFEQHCRHLAARGLVAITADYRVATRQQAKPVQCVADARSAIRWVRANAARLGVDPGRIAAAGGSAGGHLAACTAFISGFDEPGEDQRVSAAPDALVLFNPALVLAPMEGLKLEGFGTRANEERLGTKAENLSPAHHVKPGAPPTLIFHGRADTTVPFVTAEAFAARMKAAGARCELVGYEGQAHGFFNREPWLTRTQAEADRFLASLGWISSK